MENTSKVTKAIPRRDRAYYRRRQQNKIYSALASFFAEEAAAGRITKKKLADLIEKNPAQITRWLSEPSNFESDTISDILLAMGAEMDHQVTRFSDVRLVPHSVENFRNVVACDDIRDEIGNKQSLMGVFGGDIIVAQLPAAINFALYLQYMPSDDDEDGDVVVHIELWRDDISMAKAEIEMHIREHAPATILLPRALAAFEKECTFKVTVAIADGPQKIILQKKIMLGEIVGRRY